MAVIAPGGVGIELEALIRGKCARGRREKRNKKHNRQGAY